MLEIPDTLDDVIKAPAKILVAFVVIKDQASCWFYFFVSW